MMKILVILSVSVQAWKGIPPTPDPPPLTHGPVDTLFRTAIFVIFLYLTGCNVSLLLKHLLKIHGISWKIESSGMWCVQSDSIFRIEKCTEHGQRVICGDEESWAVLSLSVSLRRVTSQETSALIVTAMRVPDPAQICFHVQSYSPLFQEV
jgi:hypothetical protein